jgi:hypothetical protein
MKNVYIINHNDTQISSRIGLMDLNTQQHIETMSHPDFFIVSGCSVTDKEHGFDFILGNYNLFAFDH